MVTRAAIPKNSTCLTAGDYGPYLLTTDATDPQAGIAGVWQERLPTRRLFPTPTGRHALWYFLEVSGVRPGDEVLLAAYNFYVIVRLVIQKGLVPVFVDVEPGTLCLDPGDLARKVTPRSRLVIVTHMFGHCADLRRTTAICRAAGLLLFEDCAHAVGTLHEGVQVGQAGDGALFSFGVEKIVNSFGGGMMVLSEGLAPRYRAVPTRPRPLAAKADRLARACATLCNDPAVHRWSAPLIRASSRVVRLFPTLARVLNPSRDDPDYRFEVDCRAPLQPFMLRMQARQLRRLEANVARRRALVRRMTERLSGLPQVRRLDADRHGRANGAYFGIGVSDPARLAGHLERRGVMSGVGEFLDCSALAQFAPYAATCPDARRGADTILRLPSHPALEDEQADDICRAIEAFFSVGSGGAGEPRDA